MQIPLYICTSTFWIVQVLYVDHSAIQRRPRQPAGLRRPLADQFRHRRTMTNASWRAGGVGPLVSSRRHVETNANRGVKQRGRTLWWVKRSETLAATSRLTPAARRG